MFTNNLKTRLNESLPEKVVPIRNKVIYKLNKHNCKFQKVFCIT